MVLLEPMLHLVPVEEVVELAPERSEMVGLVVHHIISVEPEEAVVLEAVVERQVLVDKEEDLRLESCMYVHLHVALYL